MSSLVAKAGVLEIELVADVARLKRQMDKMSRAKPGISPTNGCPYHRRKRNR